MRVRSALFGALAAGICATVAASGIPAVAADDIPGSGHPFAAASVKDDGPPVTLITGDKVRLLEGADGKPAVSFEAAPRDDGLPVSFTRFGDADHLYVIPSDVNDLVPDQLDLSLFDVRALQKVAEDKTQDGLPVIVQTSAPAFAPVEGTNWSALGVAPERELESISAVAGEVSEDGAPELVDAVQNDATVSKVWLDKPVELSDLDSTAQIGATQAWAQGFDGTGATVAILDSGIDTTHPDLDEGIVTLEKDFTGSGTVRDQVGHGTHVASIVAGSGEASNGEIKGVAPGAHLLNGKVLDAKGQGDESWIVDAMEWAATNGADVINMSLGVEHDYTDGTDPGSLAVDSISARYNTLVVIAAGNEGYGRTTRVVTPGTADSALTVGAVTDSGAIAQFSSPGPRYGDFAIKPDIAAPGDDIIAARAAGIDAINPLPDYYDNQYMTLGGTSMATPHVAGAAAILKAARPDLPAQALKSLLMGTAVPQGNPVYSEGSGLVVIPVALHETMYATPASLSFGVFSSPRASEVPRTKTITYTNTTDADLTAYLALSATAADNTPVPDGMITLSSDTVTVPAHGTASVDITVDPQADDPGIYTGALQAFGGGFTPVRSVLAFNVEPELKELHLQAIDRLGQPVIWGSGGSIHGIDDPKYNEVFDFRDGVANLRVPPGRYAIIGDMFDADTTHSLPNGVTVFTRDVDLQESQTLVLDQRTAIPLVVKTEKKSLKHNLLTNITRTLPGRVEPISVEVTTGVGGGAAGLDLGISVLPAGGPLAGTLQLNNRYVLNQPLLDAAAVAGGKRVDLSTELNYGVRSPQYLGALSAPLVVAGKGTPEELAAAGVKGAVALVEDRGDETLNAQAQAAYDAGAVAAIVYGAAPGPFYENISTNQFLVMDGLKALPTLTLSQAVGQKLVELTKSGPVRLKGTGIQNPSYQYVLAYLEDHIPDTLTYVANSRTTAESDVDVKSFAAGTPMHEWVDTDGGGTYAGFGLEFDGPLLGRKVYYSTDDGILFDRSVKPINQGKLYVNDFVSTPATYKPGQHLKETFGGQIHHGGLDRNTTSIDDASVSRNGDYLFVNLPYRVDGDGHDQFKDKALDEGTTGRFQMWMGDFQLIDSDFPAGSGDVMPEAVPYRMVLNSHRDEVWWPLSTDITTEWGFTSSTTSTPTILPLLQLDYGADELNAVNTDGPTTTLHPTVSHQDGSAGGKILGLKLWSSPDDGATWTPVPVNTARGNGNYTATITAPAGASTISLRSEAWDDAGSTFKETVIDAYTVDTLPPALEITTPTADATAPTKDKTIAGTGEPGAKVTIRGAGISTKTTIAADGTWTTQLNVRDGIQKITVTATDTFGNTTEPITRTLTRDTKAPKAPVITTPTTKNTTPTPVIAGTAEKGATVTITEGTTTLATTTVRADGTWTTTPTTALTPGKHTLTLRATDTAGNTSPAKKLTLTVK